MNAGSSSAGGAGAASISGGGSGTGSGSIPASNHAAFAAKIVADLRSKVELDRHRAARELYTHVSTELRELDPEELNAFLDIFTKSVLDLVKSSDTSAKLGGILAIVALINADACNTGDRISRFGNYLRNNCLAGQSQAGGGSSGSDASSSSSAVTTIADAAVIELASKAMARLTQVSGAYTSNLKLDLIDHEMKRSIEMLQAPRHDAKRYAAVLVLREIAFSMPTFFFQNVSHFFGVIFAAVNDPSQQLREAAVNAVRAALVLVAQRETTKTRQSRSQHQSWYTSIYKETVKSMDFADASQPKKTADRKHGGLLAMSELFRASNAEWERRNRDIEDTILCEAGGGLEANSGMGFSGPLGSAETGLGTSSTAPAEKLRGLGAMRQYYRANFGKNTQKGEGPSQRDVNTASSSYIPFSWFGTVMVGKEPVVESGLCKKMLSDCYEQICYTVMGLMKSPSVKYPGVRNAILILLPRLAAFKRKRFIEKFLTPSMQYLDKQLQEKHKYNVFLAIGLLSVAVGEEIESHLKNVLTHIKLNLPSQDAASSSASSHKKRATALDPAIFACISMLARAVRHRIKNEIADMLDSMLSVGLSSSLTTALHELALYIPAFKREIADGLLKILSVILMRQPFRHPGTPKRLLSPVAQVQIGAPDAATDVPFIVLGLRTLGTFDFEGHSLLQFVRHCADNYLNSEHKAIRLEAVRTCSFLLKGTLRSLAGRRSDTVVGTINEVLTKMLMTGITDQDSDVRSTVMDCLDDCFDYHLAQAENLYALFVAMNDEVFEIREQTTCIIGRLSVLNPAYIMPTLRKTLFQLLTEMEYSGVGRNKEQSARMIGHLVANAPTVIRPYVDPILKVLVPKLKEADLLPMVVTSVLRTIGDLAQVGGLSMVGYVDELLPILLEKLNDASSSQKREVTLWTLAQLVESTGCVNEPYSRYPNFLETLLNFLRTEQRGSIRAQTLRLLGLLGALDPYRHKMAIGQIDSSSVTSAALIPINDSTNEMEQSFEMSPSELLVNMGSNCSLEDFYPSVAISALMRIIRDPTLSMYHTEVVQAVTYIFRALGIKSVPYIPQVIPSMITAIRSMDVKHHDNLLRQLGILISIVKQHIRNYLDDIFKLIRDFWTADSPLQPTIISLVEYIALALGSEFKVYLSQLVRHILRVLTYDSSKNRYVTGILLAALRKFGSTLNDYINLLLPKIVALFDSQESPHNIRRAALECIDYLSDSIDFSEYASLIIHPLTRCLDSSPELRNTAMDTLAAIVAQLGKKYVMFVPLVRKVLIRHKISHQRYDILYARVTQSGALPSDFDDTLLRYPSRRIRRLGDGDGLGGTDAQVQASAASSNAAKKLPTSANLANLQAAWAVNRRVSKDDWLDWYNRLCSELLKASPSPALRACWKVAQRHSQLAKDLFNASFVSCWTELEAPQQDELIWSLEQALTVPDLPEISQTVLNLAEFMEHCDKGPLPIDPVRLGDQAIICRAYAKALHYKETEFLKNPTVPVLESLISINNKLGQKEAATGLLEWGGKNLKDLKVHERWYEKLHDWEKALKIYEAKSKDSPDDPEIALGRMRCLENLGEWSDLHTVAEAQWAVAEDPTKMRMSRMAAAAALGRQDWIAMAKYVQLLPRESQDGAFYRAVLCVHRQQWTEAQELIDLTRDLLDTEVTSLSLESYQRAYPTMVAVQMLAELEEVIEFKLLPERQPVVKEMWWKRLQSCQRVVEDWQRIMNVRSVVISPQTDQRTWLKYASLCRNSGRLHLSHRTLVEILGVDPSKNLDHPLPTEHPQATFAYCKHLWTAEQKTTAFDQLQFFVRKFLHPRTLQLAREAQGNKEDKAKAQQFEEMGKLLARCYHKLGHWQENIQGVTDQSIATILQYYSAATDNDPTWYKAWHAFAVMNFETVLHRKRQAEAKRQQLSEGSISTYAVPAIKGFVRSITLSKGNTLQDTLRLLTLLFEYGHFNEMYEALHDGIRTIEIDNWLQVIPQLIARIDTPRSLVARLIHQVLTDLGKFHPQALVYSLTVAAKSSNSSRRSAANKILHKIREHSDNLVNQALMVSDELIRVAILWHEQWHEGLEEASRLYFGEKNIQGMLAVLEPLHAILERGPQTMKETSFFQAYGNDLNEAKRWCQQYRVSLNTRDLNQAWDLYYHVFRRISRQLPKLTQLELQYVSPKLLACRDLELAVPGSYMPNREIIRIAQVESSLQVITSKQRPRKLSTVGSNGRKYMFLLKGHEDLRQDERVMQFFSLVNSLLLDDPETFRRNLAIQRFAVIPLSTNSGLIGWVPHSDTLHGLIKDYRDKKKILLNIEHRIMQRMTPNSENLPLMNKVEVFEHSLENTYGDDLAKIMLLKAPSSEVWFDRRTNFTRSLAVMSMVGYVLGLGDRHPSNLLLDRMSGKILHIDFGDCFEVAMTRDKFPEKIPFRLTRMLINAMEVTGIEGTYRSTCESVLKVLRDNKDSLMAVLEAFVYDPLLNWRLIETEGGKKKKAKNQQQPQQQQPAGAAAAGGAPAAGAAGGAAGAAAPPSGAQGDSSHSTAGNSAATESVAGDGAAPPAAGGADPVRDGAAAVAGPAAPDDLDFLDGHQPEALNRKALDIIQRVRHKLTGRDFSHDETLAIAEQVDRLIEQAMNNENLCQSFIGWCPFW